MLRILVSTLFLFGIVNLVSAQEPEPKRYQEEDLIIPDAYDPAKKWPLTVIYQDMVDDEQLRHTPYFGAYGAGVSEILKGAEKFNFDPYRIYGTGFSRSGHGLLETCWTYPHRFAAIVPVCNDLRPKDRYSKEGQKNLNVGYLQQTPVKLLYGNRDTFVKTGKLLFDIMTENNCPVEWEEFKGGHNPYPIYYRNMKPITDFFDKHVFNPWPKEVTHVVYRKDATRAFWVDSKMGELGNNQKAFPAWKVKVAENTIDVLRADPSTKALIFHLNDKVVDMSKEVQVIWQDKVLYKGAAKPELEVAIHSGNPNTSKKITPLWMQLKKVYETPHETGSYDWTYIMMNTLFSDNRHGDPVKRRIFLDLGFRKKGGAEKEIIDPASKQFVNWDVMQNEASMNIETTNLRKKLPVKVQCFSKKFSLRGVVDAPDAASELADSGAAKSGDVVLVKVRLQNSGTDDLDVTSRINRTVFKRYVNKIFPKSGDAKNFYYGIWEIAGTRQIRWQWIKHGNEVYQVFAWVFLNPGDQPDAKELHVQGSKYNDGFYGAQRDYVLKAGETLEFPVLLMSAHSAEPKEKKPSYPDLGNVITVLKPALLEAYKELGSE